MGLHRSPNLLDLDVLCSKFKAWLEGKNFGTKVERIDGSLLLRGNWPLTSLVQTLTADRFGLGLTKVDSALHVAMRHEGGETQVNVRQGSWTDNMIGNALWTIGTGGMNFLLSQYGEAVIKDLEAYVDEVLGDGFSVTSTTDALPSTGKTMPPPSISGPSAAAVTRTAACPHCSAPFMATRGHIDTKIVCSTCQGAFVVRQRTTRK
jgi:hypothetical protein